ncbi:25302_t:CDS:1, partial [Gigaspora margarita]
MQKITNAFGVREVFVGRNKFVDERIDREINRQELKKIYVTDEEMDWEKFVSSETSRIDED